MTPNDRDRANKMLSREARLEDVDAVAIALAAERAATYRAVADECDRLMPELDWGDHFRAIADSL